MPSANTNPNSELALNLFGVSMSISHILTLIAIIISAVGLVLVVWQLRQLVRTSRFSVINERYKLIFDVQNFCFENPEYAKYWIGGSRHRELQKISAENQIEEYKNLMGIDIIMDSLEYLYLSGGFDSRDHEENFVRRLLGNAIIRDYMSSPLRGSFRPEFESVVQRIIKELEAKSEDAEDGGGGR